MFANYTQEQEQFRALVESDGEPNILIFKGESGTGKSFLIDHCLQSYPQQPSTLLKLQNGGEPIVTLFNAMGRQTGWDRLPNFTLTVAELLDEQEKANTRMWQMQMHRHLREIGRFGDVATRNSHYQLLSDAWFADVFDFEQPYLLAVDTYEKAPTEFDRWFREEFLYGVANSPKMRALVAGQRVPEMHADWNFVASLQQLSGITDAEAWMVWAEQAGYQVPSLELLTGVVIALKGRPSDIVEIIKSQFPKGISTIKPKESIAVQRQQIRENFSSGFSLNELKNISFDMGIDYENLPDHDHKGGFVRELLLLVERLGRLQELVLMGQKQRPNLAW